MSAARVAADLRFAAAPRTGAAANDEECCSAPSSAPPSGNATTRPKSPLYLASVRRPDGTVVTFDKHGNPTGPLPRVPALRGTEASCLALTHDRNGTRRTIVWDEENRIQSIFDNGHEKTYKEYDALQGWSNAAGDRMSGAADQGNRAIKRGPQGETVYVNQFFTSRPGANGTKHIYAGTTRIASKLMRQNTPNSNPAGKTPFEKDLYFYHPDHLGTSNYITDLNAKLYEHLEYFPFGEAWVEENSNTQRTPYLFTAKELDEETGLYYFGARYYDPRTSVWQSGDPILGKYLPSGRQNEEGLPGMGGVYNPLNLALYSYGHLNPVRYSDPDGKAVFKIPFTEQYIYVGWRDGSPRFETTTTQQLEQRHPFLGRLTDRMQEPAKRTLFETEGRSRRPFIVEDPVRTVQQQQDKIDKGHSKKKSLYTSRHVDRAKTGKVEAMDIGFRPWGQVDDTKEQQQFYRELGEVGRAEGLIWGGGFEPISPRTEYGWDPGHLEMPPPKEQPRQPPNFGDSPMP